MGTTAGGVAGLARAPSVVLGHSPLCDRPSKWGSIDKRSRAHKRASKLAHWGHAPHPASGYGEGEGPSEQGQGWSTGPLGKGQGIPLVKQHRKEGGGVKT